MSFKDAVFYAVYIHPAAVLLVTTPLSFVEVAARIVYYARSFLLSFLKLPIVVANVLDNENKRYQSYPRTFCMVLE